MLVHHNSLICATGLSSNFYAYIIVCFSTLTVLVNHWSTHFQYLLLRYRVSPLLQWETVISWLQICFNRFKNNDSNTHGSLQSEQWNFLAALSFLLTFMECHQLQITVKWSYDSCLTMFLPETQDASSKQLFFCKIEPFNISFKLSLDLRCEYSTKISSLSNFQLLFHPSFLSSCLFPSKRINE